MKKTIIFMLDYYHPDYSANGLCIKKIVNEIKFFYNVIIVCKKTDNDQLNIENFDSYVIIRISDKETEIRNKLNKIIKNHKSVCGYVISVFILEVIRVIGYLRAILQTTNINYSCVKNYINTLNNIKNKIDLIVPVCFPFETIVAAISYNNQINNSINIIPYLVDKFAASEGIHRTIWNKKLKWKSHLQIEKEMFDSSKHVVATMDWKDHINNYFENLEKFTFVELPALSPISNNNLVKYNLNKINIVYTGVLHKKVRPAKYTLKMFNDLLNSNADIILHLYTRGNCNNLIKYHATVKPNQIINYGSVTADIAYSAMCNSDILLSIGNSDITQQPSKIYEYMASGKPIIHLYYDSKDPVINVLAKYPKSLCIPQNEQFYNENIIKTLGFIRKYCNEPVISYVVIEKIFEKYTPKYTVEIFNKYLGL